MNSVLTSNEFSTPQNESQQNSSQKCIMVLHKFIAGYTITNINVILSNLTQKVVVIQ